MLFEHYDDACEGNYGLVGSDGASPKAHYLRLQQFLLRILLKASFV